MTPTAQPQPAEPPKIDSSDALGSLVELLGPTAEERERRDLEALKNKSAMAAWTGLFDGLRHLGNLYYASKVATPQQYSDPYAQIDRIFKVAEQRRDALDNYRHQYALQLYQLRRQGEDLAYRRKLDQEAKEQRERAWERQIERDRIADERYQEQQEYKRQRDAEADALKVKLQGMRSRGGGGSRSGNYGYTIEKYIDPKTGKQITKRVPTVQNGNKGRGYGDNGNNNNRGY